MKQSASKPRCSRARSRLIAIAASLVAVAEAAESPAPPGLARAELRAEFASPPDSARPWVYYFVMDGNLTREGITADFEAMQRAGLGGMILMEVDAGIPRGPVPFMSAAWRELFRHAVREAERLGLQITLNAGPGWTGSGGPWVKPEQSMQHLVASETRVRGPLDFNAVLPQPAPRKPFFGEGALPPEQEQARKAFYRDVRVLAFPTPEEGSRIADLDEKALYLRAPYSSQPGVKPFLPAPADHPVATAAQCIPRDRVLDLTDRLAPDGRLSWRVPAGEWTLLRLGRTSTGQNTRPAPLAGLGLESDKFDRAALESHFEAFVGTLLESVGPRAGGERGWTMLHIDSWEMSSQNWSTNFADAFEQRRGYSLTPFLPVLTGRVVDSPEVSERFLWDLRRTAQELVVENHAQHLKTLAHRHGLGLSIEPYDMNPAGDLSLGGAADVPMCEFWAKGFGFDTEFTCFEAASIAHTLGRPIVAAEAFTSDDRERWQLYPGAMKNQGDWALAAGINRIVFHRYQHQPWLDRWPGMTMGPYGVHWERTQTWWEFVGAYHRYLARCQFLLRQGLPVADICYLAPEGAPHVFRPPPTALAGNLPDRRGYNFDGIAPEVLMRDMSVEAGRLRLPHGMSYGALVLPDFDTMTPGLLRQLKQLVLAGATVIGSPPRKSPSLSGFPQCDDEVRQLAAELWGDGAVPPRVSERRVGAGRVFWGGAIAPQHRVAEHRPDPLASANWLWHPDGSPANAAAPGRRCFRRDLVLGAAPVESAQWALTADNTFSAWVNGVPVGSGDDFHRTYIFDVASALRAGTNQFAILAENGGDQPNPAGVIAALEIRQRDGKLMTSTTDGAWSTAAAATDGWQTSRVAGDAWKPALVLGPTGMAPWNRAYELPAPGIYPAYETVAAILEEGGLPQDFASRPRLRYAHRRVGDTDLYFVSNPENRALEAQAFFRVAGRQPELWEPKSGAWRALPDFTQTAGRTLVPLRFAPYESCFVVFREAAAGQLRPGANYPGFKPVAALSGPWVIRFQPDRGAPTEVASDFLFDWARHPDSGVRHFSGVATYTTQFDWTPPAGPGDDRARIWLDLGRVAVMARAALNGRDLGVVWTEPFEVEATGALRPGRNTLEIRVANLWPNRLIADASLPASERVTWTTWNPFQPGTPLLESGLLGPVTLKLTTAMP